MPLDSQQRKRFLCEYGKGFSDNSQYGQGRGKSPLKPMDGLKSRRPVSA